MTFVRYFLLAAVLAALVPGAMAQLPASFEAAERVQPLSMVEVYHLPAVDNEAMLDRDEQRTTADQPEALQFAEPFDVSITPGDRGTWETVEGTRIWRLVVESTGAFSINAGFSDFYLPVGAALWVYPAGGEPEIRSFTAADNQPHRELWTPIVPGDRMVIELNLPDTKADLQWNLGLGRLSHAYRPYGIPGADLAVGRSGSCNVDVVCPQGDPYRDIIRSVATFSRGGSRVCSGVAVNNTAQDGKPLFLTANHCGMSAGNAASMVVYWNYENSTCRPVGSSGGPGNGSLTQFNTGATFSGSGSASDWALVELNSEINPEFQVFLAGWDRRNQATSSAVAIHHPRTQEKRISFENDPTQITNYLSSSPSTTGTHIHVIDWNLGTTEPGSSGSPLFSPEKRVVGQLHGGYAACSNNLADWYGRIYHSMNTGLAQHLDPTSSGAQYIDGREAGEGVFASMSADGGTVITPGDEIILTVNIKNATEANLDGLAFANVLPAELLFVSLDSYSAGNATGGAGSVTWSLDLPIDAEETLVYTVKVSENADDSITNLGVFTHPSFDDPIEVGVTIDVFVEADVIFTNSTSVSIPDNQCPAMTTSTIEIPESFAWNEMKAGVQIQHTWRGDLRVQLTSPGGTVVNLLDRPGTGSFGTSADNLDALFADDGPAGVFGSSTAHTLTPPPYKVEGQSESGSPGSAGADPLADFAGEEVQGVWTLGVCDGAGGDTGSLQQWSLMFYTPSTADEGGASAMEAAYALEAAFPNPFSTSASLSLAVRDGQDVRAELFDALGRRVSVLYEGAMPAGTQQQILLDGNGLPNGVYVVRVVGETFSASEKVMLVR